MVFINKFTEQNIFHALQNLRSLCDDLKLLDCEIVFWNWKRQPAGVAYRLSKSFGSLFQTGNDYHEIIKKHNHKGSITSDITVIS